jgi:hypothetical protein
MSDIRLDFRPPFGGTHQRDNLLTVINRTTVGDTLTIVLGAQQDGEADEVIDILEDNGFDYQPKGSDTGTLINIIAKRKFH